MQNETQIEDIIQHWRIRRLFQTVLVQALKDAYVMPVRKKRALKVQREAVNFLNDKRDLSTICALAGVDFKEIWQMIHEDKSENKEKYDKIITYILTNESIYY